MSQSVRISIKIAEDVRASDRYVHRLDLCEILDPASMRELLVKALTDRGFERDGEHTLRRENDDGVVQTVDLEALEVTTELSESKRVDGQVDAWVDRDIVKGDLEAAARRRVLQDEERGLQQRLTARLAEGVEARREELGEALEEVYAESLKQKARSLGNVVSQQEGRTEDGEYELVIKVEV